MNASTLAPTGSRTRVELLGVQVDALTMNEAFAAFESAIHKRQNALAFSFNVDISMKVRRDEELRAIFHAADLVLVDGTPMMWAARLLGRPLPERISGSDFVPAFAQLAAVRGYGLFLLGGVPGIAERAGRELQERNPGLRVVGTYAPPLGFERTEDENARAVEAVHRARPDVLFVALGVPKQEKWLFRHRDVLAVPISMGVGSAFDYIAGRLKRAPMWMQRMGLEWTFRLAQEPRRLWRRYLLDDPPFVYYVLRERLRRHANTRTGS